MAIASNTTNPSAHRTLQIASPLGAHHADFSQTHPHIDADALLRAIATNAGVLADSAPGGDHFLLLALPPSLLAALSAYVPPAPEALPLLEMMGRA